MNPIGSNSRTNKVLEVEMCPEGQDCSCTYNVSDLHWDVQNFNVCRPDFTWTNPDANCLLRTIDLISSRSLAPFVFRSGLGPNEPATPLYPNGDERNPDCIGCGISGDEEEYSAGPNTDPGAAFTLYGYFRDEECGGVAVPKLLSESIFFETDGYVGGTVLGFTETNSIKTYNVNVKGTILQMTAVDKYEPDIGDFVIIAKINCEHDENDSWPYQITDTTVCKNPDDGYKIVKHDLGLGCG
jgi:hypothetical protein